MKIRPVDGRSVPDPERGGILAPEGRRVTRTNYWLRRVKDGDVVIVGENETVQAPQGKRPSNKKEEA